MSSARSISGARARRAGEQSSSAFQAPQQQMRSQPQYIPSQPQPQPQPIQQMQQFSPRPIGQPPQQQRQGPPPTPNIPQQPGKVLPPQGQKALPDKISISDAFMIITSRISKVEKFIQELTQPPTEEEIEQQNEENNIIPIILQRLECLEVTGLNENANKKIIEIKNQLVKTQKDLKETKEVVFSLQKNYESLAFELNDKMERKFDEIYYMINNINIQSDIPISDTKDKNTSDKEDFPEEIEKELEFEEEECEEGERQSLDLSCNLYLPNVNDNNENILLSFQENNDKKQVSFGELGESVDI